MYQVDKHSVPTGKGSYKITKKEVEARKALLVFTTMLGDPVAWPSSEELAGGKEASMARLANKKFVVEEEEDGAQPDLQEDCAEEQPGLQEDDDEGDDDEGDEEGEEEEVEGDDDEGDDDEEDEAKDGEDGRSGQEDQGGEEGQGGQDAKTLRAIVAEGKARPEGPQEEEPSAPQPQGAQEEQAEERSKLGQVKEDSPEILVPLRKRKKISEELDAWIVAEFKKAMYDAEGVRHSTASSNLSSSIANSSSLGSYISMACSFSNNVSINFCSSLRIRLSNGFSSSRSNSSNSLQNSLGIFRCKLSSNSSRCSLSSSLSCNPRQAVDWRLLVRSAQKEGAQRRPHDRGHVRSHVESIVALQASVGSCMIIGDCGDSCGSSIRSQPCCSQPCCSQPCWNQACCSQPCCSQPCFSQPCCRQLCWNQPCCNQHRQHSNCHALHS